MLAILISSMKVLDPKELEERRQRRVKEHKTKHRRRMLLPFTLAVLVVYIIGSLLIPLPPLQVNIDEVRLPNTTPVSMPWPAYGQAAIGAVGYGLLETHGAQKQLPIASIAKVITAVAVLKVKPIEPNAAHEMIQITEVDEAIYDRFWREGQSVVPVEAGISLTQHQALQALLLPSANNMAEILVRWAFGSSENYVTFVNPFVKTLGMTQTQIADASGFSSQTVSTASDLAKLAEIAMNHPVISEIVGQSQADIPVAGTIYNYNRQLGQAGINGIKTGNTDEAGGCYLFSAKRQVAGGEFVTVVGAIMGAPDRERAISDTLPLLDEAFKNFQPVVLIQTNQEVGKVSQEGGDKVSIVVRQGLTVLQWVAQKPTVEVIENALSSKITTDTDVGKLKFHVGNMVHEVSLTTQGSIQPQSLLWRIKHAGGYL